MVSKSTEKNNKKLERKVKLVVYGIFFAIVLIVALTFMFYLKNNKGKSDLIIKTGDLEIVMLEKNVANLEYNIPQSDKDGNLNTPYKFKVVNKSKKENLKYNLYLYSDNDESGVSYFNNNNIKFSLIRNGEYIIGDENTGVSMNLIKGFQDGSCYGNGMIINSKEISKKAVDNYELRVWLSDELLDGSIVDSDGERIPVYKNYEYNLKVKIEASK